jgi:hypothetical protein
MRITARYMKWDHERHEDVVKKLKIEPLEDYSYIEQYEENSRRQVDRMNSSRKQSYDIDPAAESQ